MKFAILEWVKQVVISLPNLWGLGVELSGWGLDSGGWGLDAVVGSWTRDLEVGLGQPPIFG